MRYIHYSFIFLLLILLLPLSSAQQNTQDPECRQYFTLTPKSATSSSTLGNYFASNSIDSDSNTHWFGNPEEEFPKSIYFDLGARKCVNAADLSIFLLDTPSRIKFEISDDSKIWKELSSEFIVENPKEVTRVTFNPQLGRYVRATISSSKRNYGSISELLIHSSAIRSSEKNKISVSIIDESSLLQLGNVPVSLYSTSEIIESKLSSSSQKISFSDLPSSEHIVQVICPVEKNKFSLKFFFSNSFSLYNLRATGRAITGLQIEGGYGTISEAQPPITQGKTPVQIQLPIEPPVTEKAKEVLSNEEIYCSDFSLETPRKAVASSQLSEFPAKNAIDNNPLTYWFGNPEEEFPKSIYFDLGARKCLTGVDLQIPQSDIPLSIIIEVSDDKKTWTEVKSETQISNQDGKSSISFSLSQARYVRITEISSRRKYASLSEIKVNSAPISKEVKLVQPSSGLQEEKINPSIILLVRDSSGNQPLKNVRAILSENINNNYAFGQTNAQGNLIFVNALSEDSNLIVYCPLG